MDEEHTRFSIYEYDETGSDQHTSYAGSRYQINIDTGELFTIKDERFGGEELIPLSI